MANAKICDRCRMYYVKTRDLRKYHLIQLDDMKRFDVDLCPDCYKSLEDFMDNKGVTDETTN